MGKHCNSYGFCGAFAAITAAVSWILVKSKSEDCILGDFTQLNNYHIACIVAGIIICICSLFAVGSMLNDIKPVLNVIGGIGIAILGVLAGYAAWFAFQRPCIKAGLFEFGTKSLERNVFSEGDGKMIGVFILDVITALLFFSSASSFAKNV